MSQYSEDDGAQVFYQGRWVDKENFRAFVYSADSQKLANSYQEYHQLIESGLWFSSKDEIEPKHPINIKVGRKRKHGTDS